MSKVVPIMTRKELELRAFRKRTVVSLQPRLEAIAKQRSDREQANLVRSVADRASHLTDVMPPKPKASEAQLYRQVLDSVKHLHHLFEERGVEKTDHGSEGPIV